jgi:hypothetical protein
MEFPEKTVFRQPPAYSRAVYRDNRVRQPAHSAIRRNSAIL